MSKTSKKTSKRPAIVPPTPEEDAAIIAAAQADPDAQPLTAAQLAAMVPDAVSSRWFNPGCDGPASVGPFL